MSRVIGLDPGPGQSALVIWDDAVLFSMLCGNGDVLTQLKSWGSSSVPLVIEKIESYGMAVGVETFETCFWSGRFAEAYGIEKVARLGRKAIKLHLCQSARATDANIRYALLDRFGGKDKAIGKKASPGPLYDIKSHLWAALAVAITYHDQLASGGLSVERTAISA